MRAIALDGLPLTRRQRAAEVAGPLALSALLALLALAIAAGAALALDTAYARRALPGVTVGGIAVGSLDEIALRERLRDAAAVWPAGAVEIASESRTWLASDASLGLAPDVDAAIRAAVGYGKSGPLAVRLAAWAAALAGDARLAFPLRAEGERLTQWTAAVARDVERPVVEGRLAIEAGALVAAAPAVGRYVDRAALLDAVRSPAGPGDRRVAVPVREVHPVTDPARFDVALRAARAALAPLLLRAGDATVIVDARALGPLVTVGSAAFPSERAPAPDVFVTAHRSAPALGIDESALAAAVPGLAAGLDRSARDAGYRFLPNGSFAVTPSVVGARADRVAIAAALRRAITEPGAPRTIELATTSTLPTFDTEAAQRDAAALTRVAFFETYEAMEVPSPRIETIVLPGALFAPEAADAPAGRAILAAALGAGLELLGPGPAWRNDTAHPLVVRAVPTRTSVTAELWGVPAGRTVGWAPGGPETLLRTVLQDGRVIHRDAVSAFLGPPAAPTGVPITGTTPSR